MVVVPIMTMTVTKTVAMMILKGHEINSDNDIDTYFTHTIPLSCR